MLLFTASPQSVSPIQKQTAVKDPPNYYHSIGHQSKETHHPKSNLNETKNESCAPNLEEWLYFGKAKA
jgi:hypothetical protein